jgi:hypothetical protein
MGRSTGVIVEVGLQKTMHLITQGGHSMLTKTKRLLVGLAALISLNAQAKIEQFQESYAGYLPMDFTLDGVTFLGETTFSNGSSTLTLYYEALSQLQDELYVVFGSYSRNQVQSSQLGV